ncbi:arrestin-like, C-terminal domain protein [Rhodotorula toruloides]|uniref:Arrestin-like, C-terminal domain protein n=1 Tax=Rhodotorula toruloides TaxID=5286 RepID=A0A511KNE2_RHOTO|nr:arrestin-like, C-terminal domain protein [Rhodotorula toruloides]
MSKDQPRITLRPPPHRDYLQGYPGIPASSPSDPAPPLDPLLPLSLIHRPQAHLTGIVEIRSPAKGGPIRAKWLSVELEKIETVPPPPNSSSSGKGAIADAKFVELIGVGPSHTWTAGQGGEGAELTTTISRHDVLTTARKKGLKGLLGRNKDTDSYSVADEEKEDDGYDVIPDGNYPFEIAVPEGLPPSVEIDSKYRGIAYQLVASLAIKPKKGLLKTASKPTVLTSSASILLHKGDILPSWPIYEPLLPLPLPAGLPWADEHTIGETREGRLAIRMGEASGGEVWIKATREKVAYGPGDLVQVFVQVGWGGVNSIRLTRLDFVLRETLTYRYPSPANPSYIVRAPPKVTSIVIANASVSPDPNNNPTGFAVLYQNEPVSFAMSGIVPTNHSRVTVRSAKHLDVAYHLKIRAMIEGGDEVSVDNWPVVLGNVPSRQAKGVINDVGWVEGLCDRPGLRDVPASISMDQPAGVSTARPTLGSLNSSDRQTVQGSSAWSTPHHQLPPPPPVDDKSRLPTLTPSMGPYGDEKVRLLAKSPYGGSSNGGGSTAPLHVTNPAPVSPRSYGSATPPPPLPSTTNAVQSSFVPSPTAEEEKRRYYEHATRSRDILQSSLRASQDSHRRPSSIATNGTRDGSLGLSPVSLEDPGPVLLQKAMLVRCDEASPHPQPSPYGGVEFGSHGPDAPISSGQLAPPTRSNTVLALSGSEVSSVPPSVPPPAPLASSDNLQVPASFSSTSFLGRSLTSAESEKRRLFLEAKEIARRRQEEARLELERQNRALAELEFEEAQNAFEEKLIVEAELERQEEERRKNEEYAAQQR